MLRSELASILTSVEKNRQTVYWSLMSLAAALWMNESPIFLPLYSEDKQYEVSWLFKPTNATSSSMVQRSVYQCGNFTPSYGDSCVRSQSRLQQLQSRTKGPRHSTRSAPLCGVRGWCGSAEQPGLTTPWVGSSARRECRSWSRPVCWPSEGFPVHIAAEKSQKNMGVTLNTFS